MAIRTRVPGQPAFPDRRQRKIDQAYELAGCARHDRDTVDEKRWLDEAKRLEQGGELK